MENKFACLQLKKVAPGQMAHEHGLAVENSEVKKVICRGFQVVWLEDQCAPLKSFIVSASMMVCNSSGASQLHLVIAFHS